MPTEYFKGADEAPLPWRDAAGWLADALREEERAYRRRTKMRAIRKDFPWRSLVVAVTVTPYGYVWLHWSAEDVVGPRDYDRDVVRRLANIREAFARRAGSWASDVSCHTSELSCGLMMIGFRPLLAS